MQLRLLVSGTFGFALQTVANHAENWSEHGKEGHVDQVRRIGVQALSQKEAAAAKTEQRRKDRRPTASSECGVSHGRNIDHGEGAAFEVMMQRKEDGERQADSNGG